MPFYHYASKDGLLPKTEQNFNLKIQRLNENYSTAFNITALCAGLEATQRSVSSLDETVRKLDKYNVVETVRNREI